MKTRGTPWTRYSSLFFWRCYPESPLSKDEDALLRCAFSAVAAALGNGVRLCAEHKNHYAITQELCDCAKSLNLCGKTEFRISKRTLSLSGRLDVIWLDKVRTRIIAAFEVDSSLREKSIQKLDAANAPFRFWLYYGKKDPEKFLRKHENRANVRVIWLRRR